MKNGFTNVIWGLCYKTYYGSNLRQYDLDTRFCVIKHWNHRNYGEMAVLRSYDCSYGEMTVVPSMSYAFEKQDKNGDILTVKNSPQLR